MGADGDREAISGRLAGVDGQVVDERQDRDVRGQAGCGREECAGPRRGNRLFDSLSPEHIELERTRILEGGRCHPHALPRPALNAAFTRLHLP